MKVKTTNYRQAFRFALLVVALVTLGWVLSTGVSASDGTADLLAGIRFDRSVDAADIAYLQASLQFLRDAQPAWYAYIEQAEPFVLSVDTSLSARGTAAYAECCDDDRAARVVFGYRFGATAAFKELEAQTPAARQITFLGYLVHETKHVLDRRAGRIPKQMDPAVCETGEKAAASQAIQFKHALASTSVVDEPIADREYRLAAQEQAEAETREQGDQLYWDRYCGRGTRPFAMTATDHNIRAE